MRRDPLLALTALLSALAGGALGVTGEITPLAFGIPFVAAVALAWPAKGPRGRVFEWTFQAISVVFLAYFVIAVGQGRILGAAVAAMLPVQAHALLGPATHRSLRRLHVLSFFQLLALASSTTELLFGPVLVAHLVLSPLVLTLAALERGQGEPRVAVPWSRGFLRPALLASSACLGLGLLLFLAMPRYEVGLMRAFAEPGQRMAGFSESVSLGDITSIQSSDKIVLRVRVDGAAPEVAGADGSPLRWRGKVFDAFDGRDWSVSAPRRSAPRRGEAAIIGSAGTGPGPYHRVTQEFSVEPLRVKALFVLAGARALSIVPDTFQGVVVDGWGNLARGSDGARRLRYRVMSEVGPDARELSDVERQAFLALPILDERVAELGQRLAGEGDDATRATRIEEALQNDWTYSLDVNDRGAKDPIARFLIDKAPGHCEYFASGMVVMLRSQGIPACLVTGFQQGEWSRLFRNYVVRQRDAHAWVEAFIPGRGWVTFDPTPLAGRETRTGGSGLELWERVQMLWDDNVIGFNYTFQLGFLITLQEIILDAFHAATQRPRLGLVMIVVLGIAAVVFVLWKLRRGRSRAARRPALARAEFYARVARQLARRGYRRASGQTPLEVAEQAAVEGGAPGAAAVTLTRLYYAARFGEQEVDPERVRALLAQLEELPPRKR